MELDKLDSDTQKKIQELQILEHNLQNLLMQKQAFQLELNETINALAEVKKTSDEIYKVIGSVMIKAEKHEVVQELEEKKKILELRTDSIEKQEKLLESKAHELKRETEKVLRGRK